MPYIFTKEDQKIRKRWFITLICYALFQLCITVLSSLDEPDAYELSSMIALEIVEFMVIYIFTYRNNGYKLLQLTLYGLFLSFTRSISSLQSPAEPRTSAEIATMTIAFILNLAITIWWVYNSYKIINLHRSLSPSSKCLKEMDKLQTAQNLEDLDQQLQTLKERFPNYDRSIETAYQKKRTSLIPVS